MIGVQILKFQILQITWKKWNKEHQTLGFYFSSIDLAFICFFFCFCKIQILKQVNFKTLFSTSEVHIMGGDYFIDPQFFNRFCTRNLSTLKSTQYKKLVPNTLWFTYWNLKSCKPYENETKNIKMLNIWVKNWKVRVRCSLFHFFHMICKISNFSMWTAKYLAQFSCTKA